MAEVQLFVSPGKFICSVCLDTLTDPVTIPCGHSFCLKCHTDCYDQSQLFSCPQCREKFKKKGLSSPPSQNYAGPGDVECDFCTEKKFRALKSCLTCPASYCQTHLQPHFEIAAWKDHKLVDPDGNLKEKLCEKHQKSLEIFCETDDACICTMCGVTEHYGHKMVKLEMEREDKEKQLGATLSDIKRRLEEREKTLKQTRRAMDEMKIYVERDVEENEKSFTDLIGCIEEANRKLTEKIKEQEKRETETAEGVMEHLEKEIEEQKRREAELKEISETKDHLHFQQVRATLHRESDQTGYFCPLTLDINTANGDLRLFEGNKKVTRDRTKSEYPDHPDRFDYWYQVLCREALTGTCCYWEVKCSERFMRIGIAYKGLSRKGWGWECRLGNNNKSWCLRWSHSKYSVHHNNQQTAIRAPYSPRIGLRMAVCTQHRHQPSNDIPETVQVHGYSDKAPSPKLQNKNIPLVVSGTSW
ncbi:TRI47 protein, partial [Polypterus senegalus]